MRPLEVGDDIDGQTVVTGGLEDGDRVTTSNAYRLQPGSHIALAAADDKPADSGQKATP